MRYLAMDGAAAGAVTVLAAAPVREDPRRRSRRSWTIDQKLAIVKEAQACGDPVAVVARRHDMNANHLFTWIQQAQEGALGRRRSQARPRAEPMDFIDLGRIGGEAPPSAIEIELPGGARVRGTHPVKAAGAQVRSSTPW